MERVITAKLASCSVAAPEMRLNERPPVFILIARGCVVDGDDRKKSSGRHARKFRPGSRELPMINL